MHILFLSDNFFPESNAPANRTYENAKEWVRNGHKVTVITCVPNFPKGKVHEGYKNKIWQSEVVDGINVIRVWSFIAANEGFAKRIIDYLSYMISSFIGSFFVRNFDVVIATSPQFLRQFRVILFLGFGENLLFLNCVTCGRVYPSRWCT